MNLCVHQFCFSFSIVTWKCFLTALLIIELLESYISTHKIFEQAYQYPENKKDQRERLTVWVRITEH